MPHPEEPSNKDYKADICFFPAGQDNESLHPDKFSNLLMLDPVFYHLSFILSAALLLLI
jgi:hypothetical protein